MSIPIHASICFLSVQFNQRNEMHFYSFEHFPSNFSPHQQFFTPELLKYHQIMAHVHVRGEEEKSQEFTALIHLTIYVYNRFHARAK
jgi:hypothetical protein